MLLNKKLSLAITLIAVFTAANPTKLSTANTSMPLIEIGATQNEIGDVCLWPAKCD